jgi:hypothetical protein
MQVPPPPPAVEKSVALLFDQEHVRIEFHEHESKQDAAQTWCMLERADDASCARRLLFALTIAERAAAAAATES